VSGRGRVGRVGGRTPAGLRAGAQLGRGPVVSVKRVELANLATDPAEVIDQARQGH